MQPGNFDLAAVIEEDDHAWSGRMYRSMISRRDGVFTSVTCFESQTAQRAERATALECAESQGESSRDGSANQLATPREFFASALCRLIPKTSRGHDEIRLLFRQAFALEPDAASHPR